MNGKATLHVATSLADAVAALADRGADAAPFAGGTWIMRAPIRTERHDASYVAIGKIDALRQLAIGEREVGIGACVTHAELVASLAALPDLGALIEAAGSAANPAIRNVATVGGNLCTTGFAAADLVPALLCLDAAVELITPAGAQRMALADFLARRAGLAPGSLLRRIVVPRSPYRSAHIRLPLRKAGDYPVAIVSLAAKLTANGAVADIRIAVGAVEAVARRWGRLEAELSGRPLAAHDAAAKAEAHRDDFRPREGIEAPGWYRLQVLPSLVRRAVQRLQPS